MTIQEGKPAPAFDLEGSDGRRHTLADYKGKTVVLYFYPKDDTPGCTKEACTFRDLHQDIAKTGAVVFGISKDSLASHKTFIEKYNLSFTLLSDPDAKVMTAYGAWGEKLMYGKPVTGVIRSTVVIGPDGKVRKHWKTVRKAETHPEDVLEFLQSEN
ncbi:MAG TPA: peroxiredoxin [Kiritimatiellia bacterium]|nr:peroxiredoxin [Kiritimatiellia bacterium]